MSNWLLFWNKIRILYQTVELGENAQLILLYAYKLYTGVPLAFIFFQLIIALDLAFFPPLRNPSWAQPPILTNQEALLVSVMNNKFDQNWARTFWENVKNMNFPYIYMQHHMTMCPLTQKCVTCFSTDPLVLYHFDSGCLEVSKYLNS